MKCSIPAAIASSTTCWRIGRSTIGSISFGTVLVAGRKRVPRPATGNTALRMRRRRVPASITSGLPSGTGREFNDRDKRIGARVAGIEFGHRLAQQQPELVDVVALDRRAH